MSEPPKIMLYNVAALAAQDDARRDRDIADIQSGRRSVDEVRRQNGGLLGALGKPSIHLGRARLT